MSRMVPFDGSWLDHLNQVILGYEERLPVLVGIDGAYAISEAGVNAATRAVAAAYGQYNIRCNAILPGGIARTGNVDETRPAVIANPKGKPRDIANMVVFLASDETAGYVNGALIQIDGGPASGSPG